MKKMRDTYAISFVKLVDSAWIPKLEMQKFGGSRYYVKVKTSADPDPMTFETIDIKKFENKEKFISHMVQEAIKVWDNYEAEKQFDVVRDDILEDIDDNNEPTDDEKNFSIDEFDEHVVEMCKHDPLDLEEASEDEIMDRVKEIKARNAGGWEPYLIMREVFGVDLIFPPDTATEEAMEQVKNNRPNPVNNKGIVRRRG